MNRWYWLCSCGRRVGPWWSRKRAREAGGFHKEINPEHVVDAEMDEEL